MGDLNGDGHLDLVAGQATTLHLGLGDGSFVDGGTLSPLVADPAILDLNGDGRADIIARTPLTGTLMTVLLQSL